MVQTNIANEQMTSSLRRSGNQPKGCGRDVAWNGKVAGLRDLVAKDTDAAIPVQRRSDQEIIKHHFHVIPSWYCLDHGSLALRNETGQQQCTFHLCTCHRRSVTNATQRPPPEETPPLHIQGGSLPGLPRQYLHPSDEAAQ